MYFPTEELGKTNEKLYVQYHIGSPKENILLEPQLRCVLRGFTFHLMDQIFKHMGHLGSRSYVLYSYTYWLKLD